MRYQVAVVAAAFAIPLSVHAQSAPDVQDLVGARAAGAETQLEARGYQARQSNTVRDQRYTFWWNARTRRCISVSTMDGRYAAITGVPAENCDEVGSAAPRDSRGGSPPADMPRDPNSLVLVCYGAGTRPTLKTEPDYTWDHDRHKWRESNHVTSGTEGFSSDVQIELYGDHGRIHLGRDLVPPIHSGGSNGWWDLSDLVVGPDRITGRYRLNGMNRPTLSVDRRSGRLTISGLSEFSGQCDAGNWGGGARRF